MKLIAVIFAGMLAGLGRCDVTAIEPEKCDTSQLSACRALVPSTPFSLPRNNVEMNRTCSFQSVATRLKLTPHPSPSKLQPWSLLFNRRACAKLIPTAPFILPNTKDDLNNLCLIYFRGHECMDAWMERCLPADSQKIIEKQIGGARDLMKTLCNEGSGLRREYLEETACWEIAAKGWERCVDELDKATAEVAARTHSFIVFTNSTELCCSHYAYQTCVGKVSEGCSTSGAALLRRMAWILTRYVSSCDTILPYTCAASDAAPGGLVTLVATIVTYLFQLY